MRRWRGQTSCREISGQVLPNEALKPSGARVEAVWPGDLPMPALADQESARHLSTRDRQRLASTERAGFFYCEAVSRQPELERGLPARLTMSRAGIVRIPSNGDAPVSAEPTSFVCEHIVDSVLGRHIYVEE
jgi:hypothetical protein